MHVYARGKKKTWNDDSDERCAVYFLRIIKKTRSEASALMRPINFIS